MFDIQKGLLNHPVIRYGFAVCMVAAAFLLRQALTAYSSSLLPTYITFYPAVMIVATVAGFWPGILATTLIALGTDYWILPPQGSFGIESFTDLLGLMFFSGMGVFMSLLAEFYRRARKQAQESSLELTKANEALHDLSSRLLSAHEEERRRIAGEIHDSLGACLTGISFKVQDAQISEKTAKGPTECLNTIMPLLQECIQECKRIQTDLRPSMIDDLGLLPTLQWLCRRFETIYSHIRTEQTIQIEDNEIPKALKIVIYRVTQEAMNNIAKHSKADLVRLSLRKMDRRMEITIQDNGQGFDLNTVKRGLGLSSMKERTELSGGSFAIESVSNKGTTISASWPL